MLIREQDRRRAYAQYGALCLFFDEILGRGPSIKTFMEAGPDLVRSPRVVDGAVFMDAGAVAG